MTLDKGLAASFAIVILSSEYFFPPKKGDIIKAPNTLIKRSAGIMGLLSGMLWVLSVYYYYIFIIQKNRA